MPNINSSKIKQYFTSKGVISVVTIILILLLIGILIWGLSYFRRQPYSSELPKPLQQNTPKPEPTTKQTQTYTNNQLKFTFEYPQNWEVGEITAKNEKILHSVLQIVPKGFTGKVPPIKLLYADNPNNLSLQDLEKKINPDLTVPVVYSRDDVYMLSGKGIALNFREKGNCLTDECQIYTFSSANKVYQLVSFTKVNVLNQFDTFNLIINSFKFSDSPNTLGVTASPK